MSASLTEQDMQDIQRDLGAGERATAFVTPFGVALKVDGGRWVNVMETLDLADPDGKPNESFGQRAA